jgi:hypothetical protein
MSDLLDSLAEGVSPANRQEVEDWWAMLSDASRAELAPLLDHRSKSCCFTLTQAASGLWRWRRLPVRVDSRLLRQAEERDTNWEWHHLEYQLAHPESFPVVPYEYRCFYIGGMEISAAA